MMLKSTDRIKLVTVTIPRSNMLDRKAMRALARLKNELLAKDREKITHARLF